MRADLTLRDAARADRLLHLAAAARRAPAPSPASGRAAAGRRRRGCGRWSTARARSAQLGDRVAVRRHQRHAVDARAAVASPRRTRARVGGAPGRGRAARSTTFSPGPSRRAPYCLYFRRVAEVSDQRGEITIPGDLEGPIPLFWRSAPSRRARTGRRRSTCTACRPAPTTGCRSWSAPGGLAPDLPGFGRSGKPGYLDYTIEEYDRFLERFLDDRRARPVSLVVHDWGAVGLATAQRLPERIAKLVIVNAVPLLPGYRWHRTARIWRTPLLGELSMGLDHPLHAAPALARVQRRRRGPLPEEWIDSTMAALRPGHAARDPAPVPQLAAGKAGRGGQPPRRAACAGARRLGDAGPLHPRALRRRLRRARCPTAELVEYPDAGHWGWLDRPDMIERVAAFLNDG